jgi:predicted ester cyclase
MDAAMARHFAFEAADDVEGVLSTLAPDAEHDIVGWPAGPTHGRESARPFYEQMYEDLADSSVSTTRRLYGDAFMVDESLWRGRAVGRPFGLEGRGRTLEFRILHVIEFTPKGEIARESCWLDMAAIQKQLPQ